MLRPLEAPIARRSLLDGKRRGRSPFLPPPEAGERGPASLADSASGFRDTPAGPDPDPAWDEPVERPMPAPFRPASVPDAALEEGLRAPTPPPLTRTVGPTPTPSLHTATPWGPPRATTWPPADEASAPPVPWGAPEQPEAPVLKALSGQTPGIVRPDAALTQYIRNQEPSHDGSTPFLTDRPFGEEKFYGNQFTPFFVQDDGPQGSLDDDGTDGIPTGLPPLLDLGAVSTVPPAQTVAPPKATLPPLERTWAMPQEVPPAARPVTEIHEPVPVNGVAWGAGGFVVGVALTAAAWLVLG